MLPSLPTGCHSLYLHYHHRHWLLHIRHCLCPLPLPGDSDACLFHCSLSPNWVLQCLCFFVWHFLTQSQNGARSVWLVKPMLRTHSQVTGGTGILSIWCSQLLSLYLNSHCLPPIVKNVTTSSVPNKCELYTWVSFSHSFDLKLS